LNILDASGQLKKRSDYWFNNASWIKDVK